MRSLRALILLSALVACRERLPETPRLAQARDLLAAGPAAGAGPMRVGAAPEALAAKLKGGRLVFKDDFERTDLGSKWKAASPEWKLQDGEIVNTFAENKGLWLLEKLPPGDVRIEFDVRSDPFQKKVQDGSLREEFPGDLKCEAFNTEPDHQKGYIFIFGGWQNRVNRIARLEEHGNGEGAQVVDGPPHAVEAGHTYHMKLLRIDNTLAYYADDESLVHFTDPRLIRGSYFGFNNWHSHLTFDNVAVYALDGGPKKAPEPRAPVGPSAPHESAPPAAGEGPM